MSTNVKMVGFYHKFKDQQEAVEAYRELGREVPEPTSEDFIEDNYEELFNNDFKESLHMWIPYFDYEENFGVIKLIDYEYDAFDLSVVFNHPAPKFNNTESIPFAVLYYNGSDCPLILK